MLDVDVDASWCEAAKSIDPRLLIFLSNKVAPGVTRFCRDYPQDFGHQMEEDTIFTTRSIVHDGLFMSIPILL